MDDKYYLTDNISEADMNKIRMKLEFTLGRHGFKSISSKSYVRHTNHIIHATFYDESVIFSDKTRTKEFSYKELYINFRMNTINPQLGYSETSFFNTLIYDIFK